FAGFPGPKLARRAPEAAPRPRSKGQAFRRTDVFSWRPLHTEIECHRAGKDRMRPRKRMETAEPAWTSHPARPAITRSVAEPSSVETLARSRQMSNVTQQAAIPRFPWRRDRNTITAELAVERDSPDTEWMSEGYLMQSLARCWLALALVGLPV